MKEQPKKKLIFSGFSIAINDDAPKISEFKEKITEHIYNTKISNTNYEFEVSFKEIPSFDEAFMLVYLTFGHPYPRPPEVINAITNTKKENQRTTDEYEPKQDFMTIDFKRATLWLGNTLRKNIFIHFLHSLRINKIVVTEVYDEEKFIKNLCKLDELRISAAPELFSSGSTLSKELVKEINGFGAERATIHFNYSFKRIGDKIKSKLQGVLNQKNFFRSIRVSGRDNRNVGMLFNSEIFSKKIQTETEIDKNELFTPEKVFNSLINKIRNEKG